jgi:hypothetical protein
MWAPVIGKIRMALEPRVNHWWHVASYVSARGLTTGPMPVAGGAGRLELELDFIDHTLVARLSDGRIETLPLPGLSVQRFLRKRHGCCVRRLGVDVKIWPMPVEVVTAIRFTEDSRAGVRPRIRATLLASAAPIGCGIAPVPELVHRQGQPCSLLLGRIRSRCDPLLGPDGTAASWRHPECWQLVMHDAYSHEVISCGFWPGGPGNGCRLLRLRVPGTDGCSTFPIDVEGAEYNTMMREFFLPYATVRTASDPDALLARFLERTYEAAAALGKWDRAALER